MEDAVAVYRVFMYLGQKAGSEEDECHYKRNEQAPESVKVIPLFGDHVRVLNAMFASDEPALRLVRGCELVEVLHVF